MDKRIFKKTAEELQEFLQFRRRGSKVRSKKGKGSFSRKEKHKNKDMRDQLSMGERFSYKEGIGGSGPSLRTKHASRKCMHLRKRGSVDLEYIILLPKDDICRISSAGRAYALQA